MANPGNLISEKDDPGASNRKKDHIDLAFKSKFSVQDIDTRFTYEPLLSAHPTDNKNIRLRFLGKTFDAPIWVSSMTGGTAKAAIINKNLARACGEFKMGMGLGSCRQLLHSDEYINDFQVRNLVHDQPLYANLGIAQLESLIEQKQLSKIGLLIDKLEADGLIVHVNPLQEWLQPEGDRFKISPLETIQRLLDEGQFKIIVKEVGQGMGPESICALLKLPIEALDFGASGGTNFALLEILRSASGISENYHKLAHIGHSAESMVEMVNLIVQENGRAIKCKQIIISGGVNDFLDGYYLMQKLSLPSVYGQASGFLKYAMESYDILQEHIHLQINGLSMAKTFLKVN